PKAIEKQSDDSLVVSFENGNSLQVDTVIWAIGREPANDNINLEAVGVDTDDRGYIKVDEYSNTSTPGIYAVGDNIGKVELTPVAVKA
ncbi:FAD-dependent oxidoreductase, partial [Neptunomonas phycophila]